MMLPLTEIDEKIPKNGTIIDLGCGEGVIAKYLAQNRKRNVVGVDFNKKKLGKSKQKNLRFKYSDIREFELREANGVILSDVLHHLNYYDQKKALKNVAKRLKKGGVLIIKEIDKVELIRSRLSRFWDLILYPHDRIYYWQAKDLKDYLQSLKFKVKITRPLRYFPGSTTLFVCKK